MSTIPPPPLHEAPIEFPQPQGNVISGFWRRFFAFVIDSTLLGIIGWILGTILFDKFARIGPAARLVGFCIALAYFGFFDSSAGHGQTIGKRLLRLKLVDRLGYALPPSEAIIRFFVFGGPYFLNGLSLPLSRTPLGVTILLAIVVFGVGGSNLYLLVFNRGTRQGLHDLVAGSFVVTADAEGPVITKPFWRTHWVIAGALVVALGGSAAVLVPRLMRMGPFPQLLTDLQLIEKIDGVQTGRVQQLYSLQTGDNPKTTNLIVHLQWTGPGEDQDYAANEAAKLILDHDPNAQRYSKIIIQVSRGYDLGISSGWVSRGFSYSPDEWRERAN